MPSKRLLKAMYAKNPDGMGFVSESDYFRTMDFEEFYKRLKNVPDEENCIIHFRWATHGSIKVSNCHPFHENGVYFAHNGILSIPSVNDKTDSEICFRNKIMPMIEVFGLDECEEYIDRLRESSRFAIMKDGEIHMYGCYQEMDGIYYSNLLFLPYCYKSTRRYMYA